MAEETGNGKPKFDFDALVQKSDLKKATLKNVPRWDIDVDIMEVSAAEQIRILKEANDDGLKQSKMYIRAGLVNPRLTDEQVDRLLADGKSLVPVDYILRGIRVLSGLTKEEQQRLERSFLD